MSTKARGAHTGRPGEGRSNVKPGRSAPRVSVDTFRDDPVFPRIERAVAEILATGKVVAPVDVLVRMGLLTPAHLEDWRRGRVPYLERVITCNLSKLGRILRILRMHAHDLNLVPSQTAYMRWGKGPKQRLRFSKNGELPIEEAYARHFVWPGKQPFQGAKANPAELTRPSGQESAMVQRTASHDDAE